MSDLQSRPYRPEKCCEACVFGRGEHAEWCTMLHRVAPDSTDGDDDSKRS